MLSYDLMEGESMVLESDLKSISLTTHRIRQEIKETGRYKLVTIIPDYAVERWFKLSTL